MSYRAGDVIDGRYKLLDLIGSGGHGYVFRAEDMDLSAPVAVKCLLPNITSEPVFTTRIAREARAMGLLSGTAATQILAFNRSDNGTLYIVMELLEGKDLEAYVRGVEAKGGPMPIDRALEIMRPVAETLSAAHARGIVHRDVKPANIFVLRTRARGRVRLLDFGLAKEVGGFTVTRDGTIAGSPTYMAPEIWAGKPKDLDHRADVYSFGAVVFRMIGGRLPFPARKMVELLRAVSTDPRPSLLALRPDLPEAVDPWVARVLASQPAHRFTSMQEAWTELCKALGRATELEDDDLGLP
ncbi:serine/threonine-protein kinase [Polyangium sp. 15x6]|uniref:serine/threonine-protein kinase n=1 Tax=Polyangium sp. 15x6 TaxID=3042687 RepID=UPI00249BAE38|nr:serine/threonine-protein kinase [Polyangium sp. 15x6]MDI3289236.1 serine/threonine-protein kinase [Polyangium sp. 15x6]